MRQIHRRMIIVGLCLGAIALGFYFLMLSISSNSTDPLAWMQTVGTVAGVLGAISVVMIIVGLLGRKV